MNKHEEIVQEFREHGELRNNIQLLNYGVILLQTMKRLDCNLNELLNSINEAAQKQIGDHNLGRTVL